MHPLITFYLSMNSLTHSIYPTFHSSCQALTNTLSCLVVASFNSQLKLLCPAPSQKSCAPKPFPSPPQAVRSLLPVTSIYIYWQICRIVSMNFGSHLREFCLFSPEQPDPQMDFLPLQIYGTKKF